MPTPGSQVTSIEVAPSEVLMTPGSTQQIQVTAITASGVRRCVTAEAEYQSNAEDIALADPNGLVTVSEVPGEAAILVRYMGHEDVERRARANFVIAPGKSRESRPSPRSVPSSDALLGS